MSESTPQSLGQKDIPNTIAVELLHLCRRFFGPSSQIDLEDLRQDVETMLRRESQPNPIARELLGKLLDEVDERLMIQQAVAGWAAERYQHFTVTTIEPSTWRVPVTYSVDHRQILVYATKAWDMQTEDVIISLNPEGNSSEPLRY
jgi:hypothetical protein